MDLIAKRFFEPFAFILIITLSAPVPASAITVDLAKKCRALAIKTHPPTRIGAKTGTARAQLEYYRACVTNNGSTPNTNTQQTTTPTAK